MPEGKPLPFIAKLRAMLESEHACVYAEGEAVVITGKPEVEAVMGEFFKHKSYYSFKKQLQVYGFQKEPMYKDRHFPVRLKHAVFSAEHPERDKLVKRKQEKDEDIVDTLKKENKVMQRDIGILKEAVDALLSRVSDLELNNRALLFSLEQKKDSLWNPETFSGQEYFNISSDSKVQDELDQVLYELDRAHLGEE